jgi:hypothetical protein
MKIRDLVMRCFKARIVSWLNTSQTGAVVPTMDGHGVVLAVYQNGRYFQPEAFHIPSSPAELWGPDGPLRWNGLPQPGTPGETETPNEEGTPDAPE